MTELSGFTAAQPLTQVGPQSLRLPTNLQEVCECESGCGASQILKGLAQLAGSGLTPRIDARVLADPGTDVRVILVPWRKDGVADNGPCPPGGWLAVDGTEVVGMGNDEYASRWTNNVPLEWGAETEAPTIEYTDTGLQVLFPQPTSANRPFTYTLQWSPDGEEWTIYQGQQYAANITELDGATIRLGCPGEFPDTLHARVVVTTQYGTSATSVVATATRPEPEDAPPA